MSVGSESIWDRWRTSDAGEELPSEALDLTARKGHKPIALKEVEDTLAQKIRDNANMITEVKAIS